MDGGIEQNPAYGTARALTYAEYAPLGDAPTLTLTGPAKWSKSSRRRYPKRVGVVAWCKEGVISRKLA
jgi:hypothetical protein